MSNLVSWIENLLNQPNLIFNDERTIFRVILSAIVIYVALIMIINFFGKRSIASLSMHDYVVTVALGSIVSSTIISKDASISDGLAGVLMLLVLQFLVTLTTSYWPKFFTKINAMPTVLFLEDEFIEENLRDNRITREEIYSVIRTQGQTTSDNIFAVLLESNGNLSVIKSISEDRREEITRYL